MSSELFEQRDDEFQVLYDELQRQISDQIPRQNGEEKKRQIREAERKSEDANILLHEMEEQAKKAPSPYRMQMMQKLRTHRRQLTSLSNSLRVAKSECAGSRDQLFGTDGDDFEAMASSNRTRLLQGTQILNRTTESINRSQAISAETDAIGNDIIDELGTQRESLVRTRERLHETNADLSKSRKILNSMARKIMTNKLILVFIIFLELAVLGGVVYWKFFS